MLISAAEIQVLKCICEFYILSLRCCSVETFNLKCIILPFYLPQNTYGCKQHSRKLWIIELQEWKKKEKMSFCSVFFLITVIRNTQSSPLVHVGVFFFHKVDTICFLWRKLLVFFSFLLLMQKDVKGGKENH